MSIWLMANVDVELLSSCCEAKPQRFVNIPTTYWHIIHNFAHLHTHRETDAWLFVKLLHFSSFIVKLNDQIVPNAFSTVQWCLLCIFFTVMDLCIDAQIAASTWFIYRYYFCLFGKKTLWWRKWSVMCFSLHELITCIFFCSCVIFVYTWGIVTSL